MQRKKTVKAKAKKTKNAVGKKSGIRAKKDPNDIVELILRDHKPLKNLIKVLKSENAKIDEKRSAFEEFAPLLIAHAKPEEQALYMRMKTWEELRKEAYEGDTEHSIADLLITEIRSSDEEAVWEARAKVLAELVEHHIEEEEEEMLPGVRKEIPEEERVQAGLEYTRLREEFFPEQNAA